MLILDIVFSLDSVITAVGMAERVSIMMAAVIIAVIVMLVSSRSIGEFVERHPTVKMLALSFLLLIGVSLIGEGLDQHIPKGYIYFAMGFSVFVEMINFASAPNQRQCICAKLTGVVGRAAVFGLRSLAQSQSLKPIDYRASDFAQDVRGLTPANCKRVVATFDGDHG